jgi:cyclic 2,3-diphosphoglycerate synthetase
LKPELIIVEGSGACTPPIQADNTLLLTSTARPQDLLSGLGLFRIGRADLILVQGNDLDEAQALSDKAHDLAKLMGRDPQVIPIQLLPSPVVSVDGKRIAVFTTAPESVSGIITGALDEQGAEVALVSHNLADRIPLKHDLERAAKLGVDALVVEIKAAAIDAVAEFGSRTQTQIILLDNKPVSLDPRIDLDQALRTFATVKAK